MRSCKGVLSVAVSAVILLEESLRTSAFAWTPAFAYVDQPDGGVPRTKIIPTSNNDIAIPSPPTPPPKSSPDFPDPQLLTKYATFAEKLADAARKEILPYWRQSRHVLGQQIKIESDRSVFQSASPVTLADRAAERAMRDLISSNFPDHGIYGEEYGVVREDADWVWVLDPIDGTRSFITGKPLFGTLISCLYRGTPVIGVIDQCVLEERWIGVAGRQSTLNGIPIHTDGVKRLEEAEMYSTTPDMFKEGDDFIKFDTMRRTCRTPHYGADCYAYALVASGFGADLVVEADLGLYDYCAIVPVIEGAGGVISDWSGSKLTLQNHESSKGRVVASANYFLHAQALGILSAPTQYMLGDMISDRIPSKIQSDVTPWIVGVMIGEAIAHLS